MGFKSFHLNNKIMAGINAAQYTAPTPIQEQAIPPVMEGRDVMGLAQTGTGKTAAFALPILHKLTEGGRGYPRALVIAPTRELADQINQSINLLGRETKLRSITIYGGVNINPQIDKLRRGVEIIVACPGRLLDHINQRTVDLSKLEILVLDEADHMFDMGFFPDIKRILKHIPKKRQNLMFSATMPTEIKRLADDVLVNPVTIQVASNTSASTITHAIYPVSHQLKTALLLELLAHTDTESVLIFTKTKHRAKALDEKLNKAGYKASSLQGNLSQNRRKEAMDGFRSGKYQILVATDIAARGIDVSQVSHVINFDIPDTAEAYIHRIGRTGRAAKNGDAFTLVTREDNDMVRVIEKKLGAQIERRTVAGFDYGAVPETKTMKPSRGVSMPQVKATPPGRGTAPQRRGQSAPQHKRDDRPRRPQGR